MLKLTHVLNADDKDVDGVLRLPFEVRQKSRFRGQLEDGTEVGVVIDRGRILRGGDLLADPEGHRIRIEAAEEAVSTVASQDRRELARAAYHLGNRHVALQRGDGWVRYLRDHVLDDMGGQLGLPITHEEASFEPESGAYARHGHHHD